MDIYNKMKRFRLIKEGSKGKGRLMYLGTFKRSKNYGDKIIEDIEGLKIDGSIYVRPYNEDNFFTVTRIT